jgi:glycosyltransferase involved in cell wall biosynthesis
MSVKTSIIICFYERSDYLRRCLDSLQYNAADFDEVVIADDGSSADTVLQLKEMIKNYDFRIIHAWHPREGSRRAACRNNGIRHSAGDHLVFFDADFLVLPGTVRAHKEKAAPGFFVAGRCKYLGQAESLEILAGRYSPESLIEIYSRIPEKPIIREQREFKIYGLLRRIGLANERKQTFGGHFSIFKTDIEAVNGYDENYTGWGGEDQDMALRLCKAGLRGKSAIKEAKTIHLWHPRELGDKDWQAGQNVAYFFSKDKPAVCGNGLSKQNP